MKEKKPAAAATSPELQARIKEGIQRFEELRGFL